MRRQRAWYPQSPRRAGTAWSVVGGRLSRHLTGGDSSQAARQLATLVMDRQPDACNSDSRHSTHIRHSLALDSSVTRLRASRSQPFVRSQQAVHEAALRGAIEATKFGCAIDDVHAGAAARNLACRRRPPRQRCHGDVHSARHRAARSGLWEEVDKPSDSPPPSTTHATAHDSRGSSVADAGVCARAPCEHE